MIVYPGTCTNFLQSQKDTCKLRTNSVGRERRFLVTFTFLKYDIDDVVADVPFSFNLQSNKNRKKAINAPKVDNILKIPFDVSTKELLLGNE